MFSLTVSNVNSSESIQATCASCLEVHCMWGGFAGDCPLNQKLRDFALTSLTPPDSPLLDAAPNSYLERAPL